MKMAYLYSMWSFIAHDLFLWWRQSSKWEWKCFSWGSCSELTPCHLFHSLLSKASQEAGPNSRNRDTDSSSLQGARFQGEVGNWDPFYNQSTGARVKGQDQDWLSLCLSHFCLSTRKSMEELLEASLKTRTEPPELQKPSATALMMVWTSESSQLSSWTLQILKPN